MGKLVVRIKLENWGDIELAAAAKRTTSPRAVETGALADTGGAKQMVRRMALQYR